MDAFFSKVLEIAKLSRAVLFSIWLTGLLLILLPDQVKTALRVNTLPELLSPWLGVVTLFVFILWFVGLLEYPKSWRQKRLVRKRLRSVLSSLNPEELNILFVCHKKQERTIYVKADNHTVYGLVQK